MLQTQSLKYFTLNLFVAFLALNFFSGTAWSQQSSTDQQRDQNTVEGTVDSVSRETVVVKTDENEFQLFVFDRYTTKPRTMAAGSRVRVVSSAGEDEGTRLASTITGLTPASDTSAGSPSTQATPPPKAVRDLEQSIKNDARRWRLGVRAGAALDPESCASSRLRLREAIQEHIHIRQGWMVTPKSLRAKSFGELSGGFSHSAEFSIDKLTQKL
jgi:hypothetical protein